MCKLIDVQETGAIVAFSLQIAHGSLLEMKFRGQFGLPISKLLKHNLVMETESDKPVGWRGLVEWATTRPQAYATYFLAVVLIGGLSFYAGTLKPKKAPGVSPPSISAPQG